MPDLTPAELAEGLAKGEAAGWNLSNSESRRSEYLRCWFNDHGETALKELAALRAKLTAVKDALRTYDSERLANVPPDAKRGLELFHAIEEELSKLAAIDHKPQPTGPRIIAYGETSRHIEILWDDERIEFQKGSDGRWRNIGQPKREGG